MNYLNIYKQLILKRLKLPATTLYVLKHHIVPRSIDPSKTYDKNNIVILSAREHYIAHALLVKITQKSKDKSKYYKMLCAYMSMTIPSNRNFLQRLLILHKTNSKLYEFFKTLRSKYLIESGCTRGLNAPVYNKILIHNSNTKLTKFIFKDGEIPEGWLLGRLDLQKKKGKEHSTYGTRWIYNIKTNEQKLIKKGLLLPLGWKYGVSILQRRKMKQNYSAPTKDKTWITNLELKENKLISKDELLPEGWLYGKIQDFDLYLKRYNDALTELNLGHFIDYLKDMLDRVKPRILVNGKNRTFKNKKQKQAKLDLVNQYYEEYKINGYKGVVLKFNYTASQEALCSTFNAYKKLEYYQFKISRKKIKIM